MDSLAHLWLFFLMVLGIIVLPGMDMAFVLASSLKGGRGAGFVIVIERSENFWRARIFVPGGESGEADAPVFVGIPGVMEDVRF